MYRFRTIDALLDKFNELENQEIYFASPEELNDPMEGYKDIFWKGDVIVWKNFIINYIRSVEHFFALTILMSEERSLNEKDIIVAPNPSMYRTFENKALMQQILDLVFAFEHVKNLPKGLSERKNPIRRLELLSYLEFIHPCVLDSISKIYLKTGIISKPFLQQDLAQFSKLIDKEGNLATLMNKMEEENDQAVDQFLIITNSIGQQFRLLSKYNLDEKHRSLNSYFLLSEFSEKYLSKLESSIYPDWYSASFLLECSNSAIWGHYGDNHKGVCLKFKTIKKEEDQEISLQTEHGYSSGPVEGLRPHILRKIKYSNKHIEIDFFRSIGLLPKMTLNALWYSDENGNTSICGEHLNNNEEQWRKSYWDNFYNSLSCKLSEWSYEKEYRLIVNGNFIDYREKGRRKLKYNFNDLQAIIFGIKTDTSDKLKILKIIEDKCKQHQRKEFDFYQAYYSKESGKIDLQKLSLIKFK